MSAWWKNPKCPACRKKLKKLEPLHEVRLDTAEGPHTMEVCGECARFLDMSADAILRNREKQLNLRKRTDGESI